MLEILKLYEVPGMILASMVIVLLFRVIHKIDSTNANQLNEANKSLLELARSFEKLSALVETLVRK